MQCLLDLLYAGQSLQRKTFEKRERNAEIYRRYLVGEDSVVLAQVYHLSDRRVPDTDSWNTLIEAGSARPPVKKGGRTNKGLLVLQPTPVVNQDLLQFVKGSKARIG